MITVTIPNLDSIMRMLPSEPKARTVLMRAINRSASAGRTQATKAVRKEYILKAGKVNASAKITKASAATLMAKIEWRGTQVNIAEFKTNPKRRPTKRLKRQMAVSVKKGKTSTYKGAYVGTSGKVFRRTSKARLPVKPVLGPAIPQLMGADKVREDIQKRTLEIFKKRVDHELRRMLGGNT